MMQEEGPFGLYDDNGEKINPDLIPKPSLCVSCSKDWDPSQEMLCLLNRADQHGADEFWCGAYEPHPQVIRNTK